MSPSNLFSNTELPKLLVQQWDDWHNRLHMLLMQIRAEAYREEVGNSDGAGNAVASFINNGVYFGRKRGLNNNMTTLEWIETNVDYGRSLISSGLEGARSARNKTLAGAPVTSALINSVRDSWMPAVIGAYVGALGASLGHRRRTHYGAVMGASLLGAAIGFSTGMAWSTRRLTGDMARGAKKNIDTARDAHWLEKNPIDYA